jgi:hypothetical protein
MDNRHLQRTGHGSSLDVIAWGALPSLYLVGTKWSKWSKWYEEALGSSMATGMDAVCKALGDELDRHSGRTTSRSESLGYS